MMGRKELIVHSETLRQASHEIGPDWTSRCHTCERIPEMYVS